MKIITKKTDTEIYTHTCSACGHSWQNYRAGEAVCPNWRLHRRNVLIETATLPRIPGTPVVNAE